MQQFLLWGPQMVKLIGNCQICDKYEPSLPVLCRMSEDIVAITGHKCLKVVGRLFFICILHISLNCPDFPFSFLTSLLNKQMEKLGAPTELNLPLDEGFSATSFTLI